LHHDGAFATALDPVESPARKRGEREGTVIVVYEPLCERSEHVPVNAGMIELARRAFPSEEIAVLAEAGHLEELRRSVDPETADRLRLRAIGVPPRRARTLRRMPREIAIASEALGMAGGPPRFALALSATASTILAARLARRLRRSRTPLQLVLHGYANEASGWRSRNPFVRATDLRALLRTRPRSPIQYVVLEDSIRIRLGQLIPEAAADVVAVPHPFPSTEVYEGPQPPKPPPLRIGFLGLATASKGFHVFLSIARTLRRRFGAGVEFHALGSLPVEGVDEDLDALSWRPGRDPLPRGEYLDRLRALHYVCLPYQGRHYELSASGVLADAIANLKPVIALPTPTVVALFEDQPIGHLCREPADVERTIARLATSFDAEAFARHQAGMARVRERRQLGALTDAYRATTERMLSGSTPGAPVRPIGSPRALQR
jgi:glycosyltransferase involved in cell wall biosynthesis